MRRLTSLFEKLFGSAVLGFVILGLVLLLLYWLAKRGLANFARNQQSAADNAAIDAARARLSAAADAGEDLSDSRFDHDFQIVGGTAKAGDAYGQDMFTRNLKVQ